MRSVEVMQSMHCLRLPIAFFVPHGDLLYVFFFDLRLLVSRADVSRSRMHVL